MNDKDVITPSELVAHALITQGNNLGTNVASSNFHESADKIILLAEKIKAERATIAMIKR